MTALLRPPLRKRPERIVVCKVSDSSSENKAIPARTAAKNTAGVLPPTASDANAGPEK